MQLLQLVECADDIAFVGQLLCRFTEFCLYFKVFLEVVFAGFAVQFQQVVILFYVQLVVAPQLVGFFRRNEFELLPFLLQLLEVLV